MKRQEVKIHMGFVTSKFFRKQMQVGCVLIIKRDYAGL
jgi:hypothetical protein